MSDKEQLAQQIKMAEALLGMGLSLYFVWMLIPEHRKKLWLMRLLTSLQRSTDWAARRAGAASMRAELATGQENYHLTLALSMARDRLAAAYDRTRGVTP